MNYIIVYFFIDLFINLVYHNANIRHIQITFIIPHKRD